MEFDRAVELIAEFIQADTMADGDDVIFKVKPDNTVLKLRAVQLHEVLQELATSDVIDDTQLLTDSSAEFLVRQLGSGPLRPLYWRDDIEVRDTSAGYRYRLGTPTFPFALAMAERLEARDRPMPARRRLPPRSNRLLLGGDVGDLEVLDLFTESLRLTSLLIVSERTERVVSAATYHALANSFCFHIAYNLDLPISPQLNFDGGTRIKINNRLRRSTPRDLDAPHRTYIPELINSYQLALSTDSPMLAYLSYYHVAEHWFEEVFQDELANRLREQITAPDFSYKRNTDLRRIIKTVNDQVRSRGDEVVADERNALKLTLEKFVDLTTLISSINAYDPSLINHYSSSKVSFSGGDAVALQTTDPDKVWSKIANRIYQTRNALVHRKNRIGGKGAGPRKFEPFKDDHALEPEIPLMRFIAEQIIVSSATVHAQD